MTGDGTGSARPRSTAVWTKAQPPTYLEEKRQAYQHCMLIGTCHDFIYDLLFPQTPFTPSLIASVVEVPGFSLSVPSHVSPIAVTELPRGIYGL
jgi:hypothetical protein